MNAGTDSEDVRQQIVQRMTQLFGKDRVSANHDEIEAVVEAIQRVSKLEIPYFASFDVKSDGS